MKDGNDQAQNLDRRIPLNHFQDFVGPILTNFSISQNT